MKKFVDSYGPPADPFGLDRDGKNLPRENL